MEEFKSEPLDPFICGPILHSNRVQADFGELALASAADARRYVYL